MTNPLKSETCLIVSQIVMFLGIVCGVPYFINKELSHSKVEHSPSGAIIKITVLDKK